MYEVRLIPQTDLPKVPDMILRDGSVRDATVDELANMGFFHIEGDLYQCVGVFVDGRGQHKPGTVLPGQPVGLAGYSPTRVTSIAGEVKDLFVKADIIRDPTGATSLRHIVNDNTDPARLRQGEAALEAQRDSARSAAVEPALQAALVMVSDGSAERKLVPLSDIQDGDVVMQTRMPAIRMAGEP